SLSGSDVAFLASESHGTGPYVFGYLALLSREHEWRHDKMNQYAVAFFCPANLHTTAKLDNWVNKGKGSQPLGLRIYDYVPNIATAAPGITKQVWLTFPAPSPLNGEFLVVYFESSDTAGSVKRFLDAATAGTQLETWCVNQIPGGWPANIPVTV